MSDPTFECPSCNARYKRGSLQAGQRVKCVKCETVITIPEEIEELEEIEEIEEMEEIEEVADQAEEEVVEKPAPRARSKASAQSGRTSRSSRSARSEKGASGRPERSGSSRASSKRGSSRRGRPEPTESKSKAPIFLGIGGVVVVAAVLFFVLGGKGDDKKGQGESKAGQNGKQAQTPTEKSPKEKLDEALANADKASDSKVKIAQFETAITLLDDYNIDDAGVTEQELYERILEADTNHAKARKKLGYYRFEKPGYAKSKGKWYTKDELGQATKDFNEWKKAEGAKVVAEAEKARWTKDAWTRKVAKVRDYFEKDIKPVPDFKLKYFFDQPGVPRPYLLMIEDRESPGAKASAEQYGPALQTLRKTFERGYKDNKVLADWDENKRVVPILMFGNRKSYYKYRDNGHTDLPKSDSIGAFYVHKAPDEMAELYRGTLYVWQMPSDKQFISTLFHEATHQLMHNACKEATMGDTPWIEEGMAEFWSGYEGNIHSGFQFCKMQKGRWRNCQDLAQAYYDKLNGHGNGPVMTPRELIHYDRNAFNRDRSGAAGGAGTMRMGLTYALGWGLIHFFYNYKNPAGEHPYRSAMTEMLRDELRYDYTPKKAEEYLGIKDEKDWDALEKTFFLYIKRTLRSSKFKGYVPGEEKGSVKRD